MTRGTVRAQDGRFAVNSACEVVEGALASRPTYDRIMLNHYVTKSRAEYADKMARGSAMGNQVRPLALPLVAPCSGAPRRRPDRLLCTRQLVCMHAPSALSSCSSCTPPEVPWPDWPNPNPTHYTGGAENHRVLQPHRGGGDGRVPAGAPRRRGARAAGAAPPRLSVPGTLLQGV